MTNIVGGNTSNLSQLSSSQDGSSPNPLSTNGSLDFLSLISVVYEGEKNSDGGVGSLENIEKSLNKADEGMPLGQKQVCLLYTSPSPRDP